MTDCIYCFDKKTVTQDTPVDEDTYLEFLWDYFFEGRECGRVNGSDFSWKGGQEIGNYWEILNKTVKSVVQTLKKSGEYSVFLSIRN